ncbi:MAG TPA: FIST N-terminal domain-containing protein [Spirochaetota bacterium]|nr:FIST N-terminal domain-containing protein [Spirochaetota bacterium]HQA53542.1 FIST N-terminal domain-containing protein [Spirochaetota bacterium]
MIMSTFGPVHLDENEIKSSITKSLEKLSRPPKLAIIYPSITADISKIVKIIKTEVNVPVIGATTGGAGFTESGISQTGLVGGFISGDSLTVSVVKAKNFKNAFSESVKKAVSSIVPSSLSGHSLFILADALSCDGEALVKEISSTVPIHWRLFGGLAGDNWTFTGTKVISDEDIFDDGAVFVYINSGNQPSVSVRHGFTPIEDSYEMKITGIEGNILSEIDSKPALDVYRQELEKLKILSPGNDIVPYLATYPIGVKTLVGEKFKIRTPLSVEGTSLVLAGSMPKGSRIRIMYGQSDNMIAATKEMTDNAIKGLKGKTPDVQLVIDCAGRRVMLGDRYKEQVKAIRIDASCPMLGFTSYGEIARYGGSLEGFHNTTCVTAVW